MLRMSTIPRRLERLEVLDLFLFCFVLFLFLVRFVNLSPLVVKMPSRSDAELQDVLKWLSTYSPAQPKLVQVDAATLLDTLLAQQVAPLLTPYYSLSSPLSSPLSSFGVNELVPPQDVIDAYPALLVLFLSSLLPLCFYLLDLSIT